MRNKFVVFRVAGYLCAIRACEVEEILHIAATTRLPGQPPVLHGFLNLRGDAVPVVTLSRLLFGEISTEPGLYSPLIVLRPGQVRVAMLADAAEDILQLHDDALQPLGTNHSFNDCAEAVFSSEQGTVTVLSPQRLLLAKERECIAILQAEAQRRLSEIANAPE
jgi:purine-binding chemotaxis protein CheW